MGEIFMELSQSEMKISMLAIFEEIKDKTENLADDQMLSINQIYAYLKNTSDNFRKVSSR